MLAFLTTEAANDRRTIATTELLLFGLCELGDQAHCRSYVAGLATSGVAITDCDQAHAQAIDVLARRKLVILRPGSGAFTVVSLTTDFSIQSQIARDQLLKLSRFSYLSVEHGTLTIRNPLSDRYLEVSDPALAALYASFAEPRSIDALVKAFPDRSDALDLAETLAAGGMIVACDAAGQSADDTDPARRMWQFHDLLFHGRSRAGRTEEPVGGTYSFRDLPEPPAFAPFAAGLAWTPLPQEAGVEPGMGLFDAMRRRRSVRTFADVPLDLAKLGAFLHHAVRGDGAAADDRGQATRRYPNGGGLYEQRFYLAVDRVAGLDRGLYVYDDQRHRLGRVAGPGKAFDAVLVDAGGSMGETERPPLLIVIASRFARVRWKYSGLAYALQLKHVGVIQEAMYLTATALGLGGCALGSGNTDAFGALAGLDYLDEGSLGEFVLGVPAPS